MGRRKRSEEDRRGESQERQGTQDLQFAASLTVLTIDSVVEEAVVEAIVRVDWGGLSGMELGSRQPREFRRWRCTGSDQGAHVVVCEECAMYGSLMKEREKERERDGRRGKRGQAFSKRGGRRGSS